MMKNADIVKMIGNCKSVFFAIICIYLISNKPTSAQTTSQTEIDALTTFYTALNGSYWFNSTNWNSDTDPCSWEYPWFGVECTNKSATVSTVTTINLPFNNLTGQLPGQLQDLPNLMYIYLNSNNISGTLPDQLWSLPIIKLILGSNLITGSISANISNLSKSLTYLDLQMNQLSGTIPDSFYLNRLLTGVLLNGNGQIAKYGISGPISSYIQNLTSLETFHVDMNDLTGTLPENIWNLRSLSELFLGSNQFSGNLSSAIGNLQSLTQLEISSTDIQGTIPASLYKLTNLKYLNLGLNRLTGSISSSIANLKQLTQLNLQSNPSNNKYRFSGDIPTSLWTLTNLQYLYLSYNSLTGSIPESISSISGLVVLDVGQNSMTGSIPESIFNLVNLETLFLEENAFTGTLSSTGFSQLVHLQNLLLNNNQISGSVPDVPFFSNYSLSGMNVLSNNPFICPIPSFATSQPLSATCEYWVPNAITPKYGNTNGGEVVTITGSKFTDLSGELYCSWSNETDALTNPTAATYINSTALRCQVPSSLPPSSDIPNFGVSVWYENMITSSPSTAPVPFVLETTPNLESINPSNSKQQGGVLITVTGDNFASTDQFDALFCAFNSQKSPASFINTTTITCESYDLNTTGIFSFKVSNDDGSHWSNSLTIQYYAWCATTGDNGQVCSGAGECDNSTVPAPTCICNSSFTGANCESCKEGFVGPSCLPCPDCVNGNCVADDSGNPICDCEFMYSGSTCTVPWFYITLIAAAVLLFCVLCITLLTLIAMLLRRKLIHRRDQQNVENKVATSETPLINDEKPNSPQIESERGDDLPLYYSFHGLLNEVDGNLNNNHHDDDDGSKQAPKLKTSYDDYV